MIFLSPLSSHAVPELRKQTPTQRTWLSMGTQLSATLEAPGRTLMNAQEAVLTEVSRIENLASTWRVDTPWSRFNAAKGATSPLDPESLTLLQKCLSWADRTEDAFDPVLAALIRAYGLRDQSVDPDIGTLNRARTASGFHLLVLDEARGTARLMDPEAGLEEGGFLKGYALDRAAEAARSQGARSGLLDFGGQLLAWGNPRRVSVSDGQDRQRERLVLRLQNASLSTSGCSERGKHILDPRSGARCPDWGSVSVLMPSAFEADVLSTALYVMGPSRGLDWADRHKIPAVFLPHGQSPRLSRALQAMHPHILP